MFKPRLARKSLERHRRKGLDDLERRMVAVASAGGLEGARVLEIGGGIGTLQSELLRAGAAEGEIVELVSAWEPYARELARERGIEDRTSFRVVDILESPESVEEADLVLLNRVVCCSPDGIALSGRAARLARRALVLSFPRDVLWVRVGLRLVNVGMRVMGRSFRVFLHPPSELVSSAEEAGLSARGLRARTNVGFRDAPPRHMSELGLFPLPLVLLPTEQLPLHIFEERYKELIAECLAEEGGVRPRIRGRGGIREVGTRAWYWRCSPASRTGA